MSGATSIALDPGVRDLIRRALDEDVSTGDVTTLALVPPDVFGCAAIVSRGAYCVAGLEVAAAVFAQHDSDLRVHALTGDGGACADGEILARIEGRIASILTAERTALNFLQRLMGIATLTRRFVEKAASHNVTVLDTRKTTPTLRVLEKYAVRCGGGCNHRMGLYDRVMIKDNHRRLWRAADAGESAAALGLDEAVRRARAFSPGTAVEVEVENAEELREALRAQPEWVLLDNMPPAEMARCVAICGGQVLVEASGGITLDNIEQVAACGVDAISLGCLTHSAPAADLSLELETP